MFCGTNENADVGVCDGEPPVASRMCGDAGCTLEWTVGNWSEVNIIKLRCGQY